MQKYVNRLADSLKDTTSKTLMKVRFTTIIVSQTKIKQ
jgi:hypothetical protein